MTLLRLLPVLLLAGLSPLGATPLLQKSPQTGATLILRLHEGLTEREIPLAPADGAESGTHSADGITTRWRLVGRGADLRLCQLTITNDSQEERRLEPSLRWEFPAQAPLTIYWDGSATERALADLQEPFLQSNIRRLAPWSAAYGEKEALMVGLDPGELRSYLRAEYRPGGETRAIVCATRLVLASRQSDTVTFLFGEFPIRYGGQREVVQRLHDAFPEIYSPNPDVNPAIYGASAQYWASRITEDKIPGGTPEEFFRRMHTTWDWSYAPFKRTGDHWGHEDLWEYQPHIPFAKIQATVIGQHFTFDKMPRERFLELRKNYFNRHEDFHGLMFHIPAGVWVEEQLANERYPDAAIEDPNFQWRRTRWVTGWDQEVKVLPWFTSYEKVLKEDFARIAREYNIGGIGLDVARGGPKYRGPATKKPLAIRAYDEEGLYIDQGVGVAKFIDYLHTLPLRADPSKHIAVVGNPETGGQTFTVTARYDAGMFEGPPYHPDAKNIPLARYILGRKPMTWWAGWAYQRYAVPNWRQQTQADFIKTMKGLIDYVIFASYEYASYPTLVMEFGAPKLMETLPMMTDTFQRGWQAVVPIRHHFPKEELHLARYGKGAGTRLFFGNPYDEPEPITFRIENARIGETPFVWAALHRSEPLTARVENGETVISTDLPSRVPALFDAAAALPKSFTGRVTTAWTDAPTRRTLTLRVEPSSPLAETDQILFPRLPGWETPRLVVNGQSVKGDETAEGIGLPVSGEKAFDVKVEWQAAWAGPGLETLANWPFFDKTAHPAFEIVLPSEEPQLKRRLRDYFLFCGRVVLGNAEVKPVPFVSPQEADAGRPRIVFKRTADSRGQVSVPSPDEIRITYATPKDAGELLDHFFGLLDQRFPYRPGFVNTWGIGRDMLDHYQMNGKIIE
ncbi:MAG TPA: hypothetical protein VNQ90_08180 [Chthoniobacteraceae bacterium]|nr:hypothetical protein [Chthoniobacteraceae bacterium]